MNRAQREINRAAHDMDVLIAKLAAVALAGLFVLQFFGK